MTSQKIKNYFDTSAHREIRSDLIFAVEHVDGPKVAIDCGCGAGADIEYLLSKGFKVHGFDIESESISRCGKRFKNNEDVILSQASFSTFNFSKASLVVADASLFFCEKESFGDVWKNISKCLNPSGIFCGSFLGPDDTMAGGKSDESVFWSNVSVFEEKEVRQLFDSYELLRFTEHKVSGKTEQGVPHDWHIFSVVAKQCK